ncbi:hypothetical protein GGD81_003108 [Rhodobium orientis]|uniref:hypothetical protein n=1 Tax=Rhodobium orientis TaxID=34017 RepID=UPI0011B94714|nr:hypothetical protein [Rhodobium orientis]MBB4304053.1 hypothetical protein [Rhodobium orientis]
MDEIADKKPVPAHLVTEQPESDDPEYQAFAKSKIERALKAADADPNGRVSMRDVWKKFGLEH